jgi:HlyD family secretion protein
MAEADNPQGKLLPGMTANADIVIQRLPNVLKVPAAALRWTPADQARQVNAPTGFGGPPGGGFGGPPGGFRPGGAQGGAQGGPGGLSRIADQLDLNDAQKKQWETISADMRQKMQAAFASAGGDRTQMREAMGKVRDEAFAKLEPLLKPEQKAKLEALKATMAQGRRSANGLRAGVVYVLRDKKPVAVPVRVGATDGTSTQIEGALKPGDQVIVGGGPKPKLQARTPFGGGGQQGGQRGGGVAIRM